MSDRVHPPKRDATINALMSLMLNKLHALPNAPPCYFTLLGSWLARMCLPALGWASIDAAGQLPRAPALLARLSHRHRCPHRVHVPVLYPVPQTETPDCLWCARERTSPRKLDSPREKPDTPARSPPTTTHTDGIILVARPAHPRDCESGRLGPKLVPGLQGENPGQVDASRAAGQEQWHLVHQVVPS